MTSELDSEGYEEDTSNPGSGVADRENIMCKGLRLEQGQLVKR